MGGADDGTLLFWDRRTGNLRASFHDTHPEAVTQVLVQRSPDYTYQSTAPLSLTMKELSPFVNLLTTMNSTGNTRDAMTFGF